MSTPGWQRDFWKRKKLISRARTLGLRGQDFAEQPSFIWSVGRCVMWVKKNLFHVGREKCASLNFQSSKITFFFLFSGLVRHHHQNPMLENTCSRSVLFWWLMVAIKEHTEQPAILLGAKFLVDVNWTSEKRSRGTNSQFSKDWDFLSLQDIGYN